MLLKLVAFIKQIIPHRRVLWLIHLSKPILLSLSVCCLLNISSRLDHPRIFQPIRQENPSFSYKNSIKSTALTFRCRFLVAGANLMQFNGNKIFLTSSGIFLRAELVFPLSVGQPSHSLLQQAYSQLLLEISF